MTHQLYSETLGDLPILAGYALAWNVLFYTTKDKCPKAPALLKEHLEDKQDPKKKGALWYHISLYYYFLMVSVLSIGQVCCYAFGDDQVYDGPSHTFQQHMIMWCAGYYVQDTILGQMTGSLDSFFMIHHTCTIGISLWPIMTGYGSDEIQYFFFLGLVTSNPYVVKHLLGDWGHKYCTAWKVNAVIFYNLWWALRIELSLSPWEHMALDARKPWVITILVGIMVYLSLVWNWQYANQAFKEMTLLYGEKSWGAKVYQFLRSIRKYEYIYKSLCGLYIMRFAIRWALSSIFQK